MIRKLIRRAYRVQVLQYEGKKLKRDAARWYHRSIQMKEEGARLQREFPQVPDGLRMIEEAAWLQAYARKTWAKGKDTLERADVFRELFWLAWEEIVFTMVWWFQHSERN